LKESSSDDLQLPEKQKTPRGLKQDLPGRLSRDFRTHKLEKIVGGENRSILQDSVKCVLHKKQSETRYICKFYVVPLHKEICFEKYHSVKTTRLSTCSFCSLGLRSII